MKIKICGMKHPENIQEVASLQPDYLGFIFYDKSPRNFDVKIPVINQKIKKVGVFVNASLEEIKEKVKQHQLDIVQLHGEESVAFCKNLQSFAIEIIKVFSVGDDFNFELIEAYEKVCDYFLFDTKGKHYGGNGITFNWETIKKYTSEKPYFLSGGIGIEEVDSLQKFLKTEIGQKCYAIDVNSKFETIPGYKNTQLINQFKNEISR